MFSSQPETVTVIIGESAEFGCRCEGSSIVSQDGLFKDQLFQH